MIAHPGIDSPQITAGPHRPRILRRQFIEQFRLDEAVHFEDQDEQEDEDNYPTSSSAP
jgi:hypothetical protein